MKTKTDRLGSFIYNCLLLRFGLCLEVEVEAVGVGKRRRSSIGFDWVPWVSRLALRVVTFTFFLLLLLFFCM